MRSIDRIHLIPRVASDRYPFVRRKGAREVWSVEMRQLPLLPSLWICGLSQRDREPQSQDGVDAET